MIGMNVFNSSDITNSLNILFDIIDAD